ncbi:AAA family ATPase [Candidatus Saccharibacteria bacterium]|nr:AAA family ATPase [Candidatus Saccharibacteria bacterium]
MKATYSTSIIGQAEMFESIIVSLISNGHLLLEGVPGLAKTTAAHTIASSIGADFVRIQCTPDMLPSDIIGTQIYNPQRHEFTTQIGPINHQFVLVDEINRTSAKTQSALLEAMQERQISIGGETIKLPPGFIVLATQNPIEQEGTYPLPEAQLDRFMLKHILTYPTLEEEIAVLRMPKINPSDVRPAINTDDLLQIQDQTRNVPIDDRILNYIASIVSATREPAKFGLPEIEPLIEVGASPRASLALVAAAKASALLTQTGYVTPDHVKPFLHRALRHRIALTYEAEAENVKVEDIIDKIGSVVAVP